VKNEFVLLIRRVAIVINASEYNLLYFKQIIKVGTAFFSEQKTRQKCVQTTKCQE